MNSQPISPYAAIEIHDPALYQVYEIAQGVDGGLAGITDAHLAQFYAQGYLVVNEAFTPDEVREAITGLVHLIAGGCPEFRSIQFEATMLDRLDTLTVEERHDAVRKLMWFVDFEPRLKALSHHPALLAVVTRLLNALPVMFQDQALLKPPRLGREKPWHQDKAYFNLDRREPVVGVWVALDEATLENGCMHLLPDLGREPIVHFQRRDWQVCDSLVLGKRAVAVPLKPGSLLLFDGLLVHGTPHNGSPARRRAVQFHYHASRFKPVSNDERMAVFGDEGKNVTC